MTIRLRGDPVLSQKAWEVTEFNEALETLGEHMVRTMYEANGIGLAAPQIGLSTRFLVIDLCRKPENPEDEEWVVFDGRSVPESSVFPLIVANPSLEPLGSAMQSGREGCLSVPDKIGEVRRFVKVRIRFQDTHGDWHTAECQDLLARCFQHEIDHLDGVLFVEKAENIRSIDRSKPSKAEKHGPDPSADDVETPYSLQATPRVRLGEGR
jgi:peptide deformylase